MNTVLISTTHGIYNHNLSLEGENERGGAGWQVGVAWCGHLYFGCFNWYEQARCAVGW